MHITHACNKKTSAKQHIFQLAEHRGKIFRLGKRTPIQNDAIPIQLLNRSTGHLPQIELVHSVYFSVLHINVLSNLFFCFKTIALYQDAQNKNPDYRGLDTIKKTLTIITYDNYLISKWLWNFFVSVTSDHWAL